MPIFHKNRQNLQNAKTDKSQQILQGQTTENHSIFCQNLENAVEPKTKKEAVFTTQKNTPINKKHAQKNLTSTQDQTPQAPRKKFLKIFAAASLALITSATTLLATTPFGSGAASAATNTNLSNNTQTTSPLGLDPENDPVLFKTSSGLEIKFGGATLESGALTGYAYFTMGTYNEAPVKWVIIGYHSTFSYMFGDKTVIVGGNGLLNDTVDISPAGMEILKHNSYGLKASQNDSDLDPYELLCLSETTLGNSIFKGVGQETAYETCYGVSALKTYIDNLYETGLGLSELHKESIEEQTLVTYNYGKLQNTTGKLFPLAHNQVMYYNWVSVPGQNFCVTSYLTTEAERSVGAHWWTRTGKHEATTGTYPVLVQNDGYFGNSPSINSNGVRPACVIKLHS